jgi:polysaccharide biosynthesis protein PelA
MRVVTVLFCSLLASLTLLYPRPAQAVLVRREILAVYDGKWEPSPSDTVIHRLAEMPLNYLGYILDFYDVRQSLPPPTTLQRYAAVIAWFTHDVERPAEYLEWAAEAAEQGIRFVIIGSLGAPATSTNLQIANRVLDRIGVKYKDEQVEVTTGSRVVSLDAHMIGFERPLDPVLPSYPIIERASPNADVHLDVEAPPRDHRFKSALVTTGPGGGYVVPGFEIYYDSAIDRAKWIINPFEFFRQALGQTFLPIPDTTTVSGRRLFFSQVDGDGWNNGVWDVSGYQGQNMTAAEVMLHKLIEPYPDLPITVGLIAGDIDPKLNPKAQSAARIAREIFKLPQVEVGSHTYTHPFDWKMFDHYDPSEKTWALDTHSLLSAEGLQESVTAITKRIYAIFGRSVEKVETHGSGPDASNAGMLPRAYVQIPFSLDTEVDQAIAATQRFAPAGKTVRLYQWSGDCFPFEEIVERTRKLGLRNMNGGDSRFDLSYPSIGYVAPISRTIGKQRQIYAVNSNENTYTDDWSGHFGNFRRLRETIDNTESPLRLKGVNVYFHVFSAERNISLQAIRQNFDWARSAPLAPIPASHYSAIADGFFSTKIEQLGAQEWALSARDGLQTVRFDDAAGLDLDLQKSVGVLGSNRVGTRMYVALDANVEQATVALKATVPTSHYEDTTSASLTESRWRVRGLVRKRCEFDFQATGFGPGQFLWSDLPAGRYRIEVARESDVIWTGTAVADADGRLQTTIPLTAISPLDIKMSCADPRS